MSRLLKHLAVEFVLVRCGLPARTDCQYAALVWMKVYSPILPPIPQGFEGLTAELHGHRKQL